MQVHLSEDSKRQPLEHDFVEFLGVCPRAKVDASFFLHKMERLKLDGGSVGFQNPRILTRSRMSILGVPATRWPTSAEPGLPGGLRSSMYSVWLSSSGKKRSKRCIRCPEPKWSS